MTPEKGNFPATSKQRYDDDDYLFNHVQSPHLFFLLLPCQQNDTYLQLEKWSLTINKRKITLIGS